jgi:hypothetical protein
MNCDEQYQIPSLIPGTLFPQFQVETNRGVQSDLGNIAGRFVLLCVFGSVTSEVSQNAISALKSASYLRNLPNDPVAVLVACNPQEKEHPLIRQVESNMLVIRDYNLNVVTALGLLKNKGSAGHSLSVVWILIDPMFRIAKIWPLRQSSAAISALVNTPPVDGFAGVELSAPVLIAPSVFEPALCRELIDCYLAGQPESSGVARVVEGKLENVIVPARKRRFDYEIKDQKLRDIISTTIAVRLLPQIFRAFQYRATRIERQLVACYDAEGGGFFKAHRDNSYVGTKHRAFAVTINLNPDEHDGGDLRFPEFGSRTYRAPKGGAVVFSCALLHEALPVTRGLRYAFLPFLFDEAGQKLLGESVEHIGESARDF